MLAYAATAVPATMDGGGVLYDTKDPFEVARVMAAILDDADLEDAVVATQDAALDRLLAKDFGGTLLRFVDQVRATAAASGAGSAVRLLGDVRSGRAARGAAPVQARDLPGLADGRPRSRSEAELTVQPPMPSGPRTSDLGPR